MTAPRWTEPDRQCHCGELALRGFGVEALCQFHWDETHWGTARAEWLRERYRGLVVPPDNPNPLA